MVKLDRLREECLNCGKCPLAVTRRKVVFGDGDEKSGVMFIGEGPGANEDAVGLPFVGRAGQLLENFLESIGLIRQQVYIANMVKCRPPENRDPHPEEVERCIGYLNRQIELIKPKIIVCLGRVAACYMIDKDFKVTRRHGEFIERDGILYMATYHPAAILRNPNNKPDAFGDFLALRAKMRELGIWNGTDLDLKN